MKNIARLLTLVAFVACAVSLYAQSREAAFDSAAQAYAFAASVESPLVVRTSADPVRYVVYLTTSGPVVAYPKSSQLRSGDFFLYVDSYLVQAGTNAATFDVPLAYRVAGRKVVGAQQPAIPDAEASIADLRAKLNMALDALRAHGLIAQ